MQSRLSHERQGLWNFTELFFDIKADLLNLIAWVFPKIGLSNHSDIKGKRVV
jgi:hypothetical protein